MKIEYDLEKVKKLIKEGKTTQEIGEIFNSSRGSVSRFLKENNLKTQAMEKTERTQKIQIEHKDDIINMYQSGMTIKEIYSFYGISDTIVKKILKNNNIHIRTNSENHTKYLCDIHYFDKIDSLDKSYLLGFICADGFVTDRHEVGIGVQKEDEEIIKFFQSQLKSNKPIYYKDTSCELRLQNKYLAQSLINLYVTPRKSLTLDISKVIQAAQLTDEQIKAFLLGYFDGDGCISHWIPSEQQRIEKRYNDRWQWTITGTYETCDYYRKYFSGHQKFSKRHVDDHNNYTYPIGGTVNIINTLGQLYSIKDKLTFYLKRKYNKFSQLLSEKS